MAKKEYKRLSVARYWFRISSLWMGQGHVLLATSSGFVENYKRFYFRDIQAVLLRPHNRRNFWSLVYIVLYLIFLLIRVGLQTKDSDIFWFWTVFFGGSLVVNFILGQGCSCQLKTAIQTVDLPIKRMRVAKKIFGRLRPLIEAAQQDLPAGDNRSASAMAAASLSPQAPVKGPFKPLAHGVLFGTLLLGACLEAGRFYTLNFGYYLLDWFVSVGVVIPLVIALVWQSRSETPKMLRRLTGIAIFYVVANYLLGIAFGVSLELQHAQIKGQFELMKLVASQPPDATTFSLVVTVFTLVFSSVLGLIGTLELLRVKRPVIIVQQ